MHQGEPIGAGEVARIGDCPGGCDVLLRIGEKPTSDLDTRLDLFQLALSQELTNPLRSGGPGHDATCFCIGAEG